MPACFLTRNRKAKNPDEKGGEEELGGIVGGKNHNQKILYAKNLFSIKRN